MATLILPVSLLLVVLGLTPGKTASSDDSHCSYMFKVPAAECGRTSVDEQFMKSSMIALHTQMTQMNLATKKQTEDIRKLTEVNEKLREKIASIEAGGNLSAINVKQCSKRGLNDRKHTGLLFSCEFVKKRDDTVLRVVWNGSLRLANTGPKGNAARRWFFTINGKECREPRTIDTQLHVHNTASNSHRPAYVEGYCRGIPAGDVNVAWNIGDIVDSGPYKQSYYNTGASYTGWEATVRIIVEEVDVKSADIVIV